LLGQPADRLFAVYMAVAGLALLFPNRPARWSVLLALHLLVVALGWPVASVNILADRLGGRARRLLRSTADWLPLLLIPALYTELATLNLSVHGGVYFDATIIAWEQLLFGGQPSREWAAAAPFLWLSEPLHAAYLSYYLIIFGPPFILFVMGRTDEFRTDVFVLLLAFFVNYVFFIYYPVQGPRYLFPPPGGHVATGEMYQLAHRLLEAGSSRGAAFPSSHVGVAVAQTLLTIRFLPRLAPLIGLLTAGLALGAIYGGFHYATDVAAGVLLGVAAFLAAPRVAALLGSGRA
jgi:membrane-associated phospholipid phosphatase